MVVLTLRQATSDRQPLPTQAGRRLMTLVKKEGRSRLEVIACARGSAGGVKRIVPYRVGPAPPRTAVLYARRRSASTYGGEPTGGNTWPLREMGRPRGQGRRAASSGSATRVACVPGSAVGSQYRHCIRGGGARRLTYRAKPRRGRQLG